MLLQLFSHLLFSLFKRKHSILLCFAPVLYAAIGLAVSGLIYYNYSYILYDINKLKIIYNIAVYVFAIGVGVGFMSAAFKAIFTKTPTNAIDVIDIDGE